MDRRQRIRSLEWHRKKIGLSITRIYNMISNMPIADACTYHLFAASLDIDEELKELAKSVEGDYELKIARLNNEALQARLNNLIAALRNSIVTHEEDIIYALELAEASGG